MSYDYAMKNYGIDKPDMRFDMKFVEITDIAKGKVRIACSLRSMREPH